MALTFREDRATQAAAYLLRLGGGRMGYFKLLKLIYFADREALLTLGHPITFDRPVSMDKGPVLSRTYNLAKGKPSTGDGEYWREHISDPFMVYWISLKRDPSTDQLSPAEEAVLDHIHQTYGHMSGGKLSHLSHALPEWKDPKGSSVAIDLADILRGAKMPENEVEELLAGLKAHASL
jgi:uncharacterized phage-associated protein